MDNDFWRGEDDIGSPILCRRCGVPMERGYALANRATAGAPDFIGSKEAVTYSVGQEADLVPAWKCPECGHSLSM